jgi:hypothetical protein
VTLPDNRCSDDPDNTALIVTGKVQAIMPDTIAQSVAKETIAGAVGNMAQVQSKHHWWSASLGAFGSSRHSHNGPRNNINVGE